MPSKRCDFALSLWQIKAKKLIKTPLDLIAWRAVERMLKAHSAVSHGMFRAALHWISHTSLIVYDDFNAIVLAEMSPYFKTMISVDVGFQ